MLSQIGVVTWTFIPNLDSICIGNWFNDSFLFCLLSFCRFLVDLIDSFAERWHWESIKAKCDKFTIKEKRNVVDDMDDFEFELLKAELLTQPMEKNGSQLFHRKSSEAALWTKSNVSLKILPLFPPIAIFFILQWNLLSFLCLDYLLNYMWSIHTAIQQDLNKTVDENEFKQSTNRSSLLWTSYANRKRSFIAMWHTKARLTGLNMSFHFLWAASEWRLCKVTTN